MNVLVHKSLAALERSGLARLVVAGGVGANAHLRGKLNWLRAARRARALPELALCTDNGAMIALAAAMRLQRGSADARRRRLRRAAALAAGDRRGGGWRGQLTRICVARAAERLASVSVSTPFSKRACDAALSTSSGSTTVRAKGAVPRSR